MSYKDTQSTASQVAKTAGLAKTVGLDPEAMRQIAKYHTLVERAAEAVPKAVHVGFSSGMAESKRMLAERGEEFARAQAEIVRAREEQLSREHLHANLAVANTAAEFHKRLIRHVVEFDKSLDESEEVGVRLVSFGQALQFHVRDIGYTDPSMITFRGVTEDGQHPVQLIQHVTQISFLLMAMKRLNPDEPKQEMGFHTLHREWCERADADDQNTG